MGRKFSATDFLALCSSGKVREAFSKYIALGFKRHNPHFAGDSASLMEGMLAAAKENPKQTFEVQRAIEDNELVAVHSKVTPKPGGPSIAVVHLFRFEGDRVVELWDVVMPVPAQPANVNRAF
jgi:predicted SnoaL-like aldol condensation-catalyzing enzyme